MNESSTPVDVEIVVPVYNEQRTLEASVRSLHSHLGRAMPERWHIVIADNASTDATAEIADRLASELDGVMAAHLPAKGRGNALRTVWSASDARVLAYLDVDLSTDLAALRPLLAPLLSGHSDLAIGTRLARGSRIVRGGLREFTSRSYNLLLRTGMNARFSDAQCGFKAIRADVAHRLLPWIQDGGWFFDTELLVLAERSGLRIHEVPVDWIDDPGSSVDIVRTALADLRGMARMSRALARGALPVDEIYAEFGRHPLAPAGRSGPVGQLLRFGGIGVLSTIAFALLYLVLTRFMPAQPADFVALLATAVANTAANRRFTFGVRGPERAATHQLQGLVVFGIAWAITAGSLALLHRVDPGAGPWAQVLVLTVSNLVATALRFVMLRFWVFRRPGAARSDPGTPGRTSAPLALSAPKPADRQKEEVAR